MNDRTLVFWYPDLVEAQMAGEDALSCDQVMNFGLTQAADVWLLRVEVAGPNFVEEGKEAVRKALGRDLEVVWPDVTNAHVARAERARVVPSSR